MSNELGADPLESGGEGTQTCEPVRLIVTDDLERNRFTVLLRLLLSIPHLIFIGVWGGIALLAAVLNWLATLVLGRPPAALHGFLAAYVRYTVHVSAYLFLAANPYPGFLGDPGYPIDVRIGPPCRQSRWTILFRIVLAIPVVMIAAALAPTGARTYGTSYGIGLLGVMSFLGWFVAIAMKRMPRGLRDAMAYAICYTAQLDAYLFLLTDRYPCSDPIAAIGDPPVRSDPISLEVKDELRRSRLTVFFRLLLTVPHLLWLFLWVLVACLAAVVNWVVTLVLGRSPGALHRFLAAFLRYQTHVCAYLYLVGNPFPGFTGQESAYPVMLTVAPPQRQNRLKTLLRLPLALPALMIASAYSSLLSLVALLGWFSSLATGRMPLGLRNAGALSLRYSAQTTGYLLLLTDSYPYSGPTAQASAVDTSPERPIMPTSAISHAAQ